MINLNLKLLGNVYSYLDDQDLSRFLNVARKKGPYLESCYGEFIVHHRIDDHTFRPVDFPLYKKVAALFEAYHPARYLKEDRVTQLKTQIGLIDSTLELSPIPKTLYELTFLRKCIEEDLDKEAVFTNQNPNELPNVHSYRASHNSWIYQSLDSDTDVSLLDTYVEAAFRLNQAFNRLLPMSYPLTYNSMRQLLESHLRFFQHLHEDSNSKLAKRAARVYGCNNNTPLTHFSSESTRGSSHPLGIHNSVLRNIVRNAFNLECQAQNSLILYRGGKGRTDFNLDYSLSYGLSLFAGSIHDQTATAFYYARKKDRDMLAFVVAPQQEEQLLSIPREHALVQLFRLGESFHPRRMIPLGLPGDDPTITGIEGDPKYSALPPHLKSTLNCESFSSKFRRFYQTGIALKTAQQEESS